MSQFVPMLQTGTIFVPVVADSVAPKFPDAAWLEFVTMPRRPEDEEAAGNCAIVHGARTRAATAAVTKAVDANWVVFVPGAAVGAVGVPVNVGDTSAAASPDESAVAAFEATVASAARARVASALIEAVTVASAASARVASADTAAVRAAVSTATALLIQNVVAYCELESPVAGCGPFVCIIGRPSRLAAKNRDRGMKPPRWPRRAKA